MPHAKKADRGHLVAEAAVVAVVSADSPIVTISKTQIIGIFLGKTTRFPNGSTAVPIDQTEGSAERDEHSLNGTPDSV